MQTTKSDIINYYNSKTYCYSFLLSHKLILIVSFPYIPISEYDSKKKNIFKLEYFLLDIEFFENKDADEKIDYNKYAQHEELLSHIKKFIEDEFKKVFCNSVYQGCARELSIYLTDINEAISCCTHGHLQISLSELFYLIQEIFLPTSLKRYNKYENIKISAGNIKNKQKRNKKTKPKTYFDEPNSGKISEVSPNSPYLRKFKSIVLGATDLFEFMAIPAVEAVNRIFMEIIDFFFKKINNTNYYVSHCLPFENFLEKIRRNGDEIMGEYLNSTKKIVLFFNFEIYL